MIKVLYKSIVFTLLFLSNIQTIQSQISKINSIKIESHLPTHLYTRKIPPSFVIRIDTKDNLRGKLNVRIKKITDDRFTIIYEKNIKIIKGVNTFNFVINQEAKKYKFVSEFYEIYSQISLKDGKKNSDTLTFAFEVDSLRYESNKPNDFETFWKNTFAQLDTINPTYTIDTMTSKRLDNINVYKLTFSGFDSTKIKGWYCLPNSEKALPAVLILPSYGNGPINIPYNFCENGIAALSIQIHGLDVENDNYPAGDFMIASYNLDSPDYYYLKKAVAYSRRALQFLISRPEIDTTRIAVVGASQGGGLALLLSGLDSHVRATVATIPTLISFPESYKSGCCWRIRNAVSDKRVSENKALSTLLYFDAINLIDNYSQHPILLTVHFKDRISPPNAIFSFYNKIPIQTKQIIVHPELGHEFLHSHWDITINFLKMIFNI